MSLLFELTHGYLAYVVILAGLTLCGLGAQRLLRAPFGGALRWLLAPILAQAVAACALGGAVSLSIAPLKELAPVLWLSFGALALAGIVDIFRPHDTPREPPVTGAARWRVAICFALAALLPFGSLWPYLRDGFANLRGSGLWDGWSYVAVGQYFWDYARGTYQGGPQFYGYGASFDDVRFVACAQLAFLASVLRAGDVQSAFGLFQASGLFTTLAACAAFAWTRGASLGRTSIYLLVCGLSGWFANVVWANNCDHLLALAYMPALLAVIDAPGPLAGKRRVIVLLVAGPLYTYPEMAWVPLGASLPWAWRRLRERGSEPLWPTFWRVGAWASLLALPYLAIMLRFFAKQVASSMGRTSGRPGEGMLRGLIEPEWAWSAVWGLGGEHHFTVAPWGEMAIAAMLAVLFLAGLKRVAQEKQYELLAVTLVLVALVASFALVSRYSYGTYKVLLSGWWLFAWTLSAGAVPWRAPAVRGARAHARQAWLVLAVATLCAPSALVLARNAAIPRAPRAWAMNSLPPIEEFRALREIVPTLGGRPVGFFFRDLESSYWALYYLRDQWLRFPIYRGYIAMPSARRSMARGGEVPWERIRYLLTDSAPPAALRPGDGDGWTPVWSRGGLQLWDTGVRPWLAVTEVNTPNGFETSQQKPFFWLGGGATRLALVAQRAGVAELSAEFLPGPSAVGSAPGRRVRIRDGIGGVHIEVVHPGPGRIAIPVRAGLNIVKISAIDAPTVAAQPNGDARVMLLGVRGPRLAYAPVPDEAAPLPTQ